MKNKVEREISKMIRVNHAGEYAAKAIYEGQIRYWKDANSLEEIKHMQEQEERHLAVFEEEMKTRHVRPSLLLPLLGALGYGLGAVTAMMGKEAGMACTSAVEEVIGKHYGDQLDTLKQMKQEENLHDKIERCYKEEMEHMHIADTHNQTRDKRLGLLSNIIKCGSKIAIEVAKVI